MSKLPNEFVKAPTTTSATRPRRGRKTALAATAEKPRDPRELVLLLTDEEHRSLEEARAALERAGEVVTLEQMLHRILADWMLAASRAVAPVATVATSTGTAGSRDPALAERIRSFIAAPLRTWRDLGRVLRRVSELGLRRAGFER